MVSTGQIINLIFIAGGVYIAITYGPDIVKWAKSGIASIKTSIDQGSTPGDTGAPAAPSGDDQTQSVPPQSQPNDNGNGTMTITAPPPDSSGPPSAQADKQTTSTGHKRGHGRNRGSQNLRLSGGTAPIKQPDKTNTQWTPEPDMTPDWAKGFLEVGQQMESQTPTLPASHPPPAKPVKKSATRTIPPPPPDTVWPDPQRPFNSVYPPEAIKTQPTQHPSTVSHPSTTTPAPVTPATRSRHRHPAAERRVTPPSNTTWPDPQRPFSSVYPSATIAMGLHCTGPHCCFTGRECDGSIGQECMTINTNDASARQRAATLLRSRFLSHNKCAGAKLQPRPLQRANAGYAFGDKGQLISLDAMVGITIA